jgi:hypothetical protein
MKFELITIENVNDNHLWLVGRNEEGKRATYIVEDFYPYLYVEDKTFVGMRMRGVVSINKGVAESWNGRSLTKVEYEDRDRKNAARRWTFEKDDTETYEGDVDYVMQFKVDKAITNGFIIPEDKSTTRRISHVDVEGY